MKHWSDIKEKAAGYWRLLLMLRIYQIFGDKIVKIFASIVIFFVFISCKKTRNFSQQYLQRIYKIKQSKQDFSLKKPHFFSSLNHLNSFASSLVDRIACWSGNVELNTVNIKTPDTYAEIKQDLERNHGCFLICSHVGNPEFLRALGTIKTENKLQVNSLIQINHTAHFNRLLAKLNCQYSTNLISATDVSLATAINLKEKIQNGEIVVTAGDRTATNNRDKFIATNFLGNLAKFPIGSFVMARLMEAPVYFLFCVKAEKSSCRGEEYDVYFFKSQKIFTGKGRKGLNVAVEEYSTYLEEICLKYPYQWFNFFDFWRI